MCTVLRASVVQADVVVSLMKNMLTQKLPHHAQSFALHVTTPALTVRLSRLSWFSPCTHVDSREHLIFVEWEIIQSARRRTVEWELLRSEPLMDAMHSAVVGSACAGLVLDAGCHEVRSSDVWAVGDTRESFSEK